MRLCTGRWFPRFLFLITFVNFLFRSDWDVVTSLRQLNKPPSLQDRCAAAIVARYGKSVRLLGLIRETLIKVKLGRTSSSPERSIIPPGDCDSDICGRPSFCISKTFVRANSHPSSISELATYAKQLKRVTYRDTVARSSLNERCGTDYMWTHRALRTAYGPFVVPVKRWELFVSSRTPGCENYSVCAVSILTLCQNIKPRGRSAVLTGG
ncbi:hypothetical protein F2P81_009882 [Scophthalmus maximus]|uniref:Uncharacterized protein n=1 Tax=Scophthalmus maximus TaxID=52904 RepID=A0A6A4SY14_SCOMX|nr:hypothetical protein F2P81_009882 [Scophthalmus maximus]